MKKFLKSKLAMVVMMVVLACSMSSLVFADQGVVDGTYSIDVTSSSAMFKIVDAKLNVLDGKMSAVITLSGTGYSKLYMGTEEEAISNENGEINYVVDENGKYTYAIPVSALDTEINVAAFSTKKEIWYGRTLIFNSSTLVAIEEQQKEEIKEEVEKVEEATKETVKETKEQEIKEEAIPKTRDSNNLVISIVVLLTCIGIIAKNKIFIREA